jgi:hypothetical protein
MEGTTGLAKAKHIMKDNFIGPDELLSVAEKLKVSIINKIPEIPFSTQELQKTKDDFILILGSSKMQSGDVLSLNSFREVFGTDPAIAEPCFYNQDWYINEGFAQNISLSDTWYLIRKELFAKSRGITPEMFIQRHPTVLKLPSAILCTYTFFSYYYLNEGAILWPSDYIWCNDRDHNGDQVYVGRYVDPAGLNKNGFSIHRHLSIKENYGCLEVM